MEAGIELLKLIVDSGSSRVSYIVDLHRFGLFWTYCDTVHHEEGSREAARHIICGSIAQKLTQKQSRMRLCAHLWMQSAAKISLRCLDLKIS